MNYGGDWIRRDSNFDNISFAMLTMFKVALTEGWLDIMYWGMDNRGPDMVGVRNDSGYVPAFFFSFFIVIGSFFILNLFDGIVIDNFNTEQDKFLGLGDFSSN
jgi:hypothetical protein